MEMTTQKQTGTELRYNPSLEISPLVEVSKTIHAPIAEVWKAWAQPELIRQWWGPKGFSCPYAVNNFKVGGDYLFAMKEHSTGKIQWSTGLYQKIDENKKLVFTDHFSNSEGKIISAAEAGMPGDWPEVFTVTVKFKDVDFAETLVTLCHEGIPAQAHDDCVAGWTSILEKMDRFLARR